MTFEISIITAKAEISLCCQHSFQQKSKTKLYTSCYEEHELYPRKTSTVLKENTNISLFPVSFSVESATSTPGQLIHSDPPSYHLFNLNYSWRKGETISCCAVQASERFSIFWAASYGLGSKLLGLLPRGRAAKAGTHSWLCTATAMAEKLCKGRQASNPFWEEGMHVESEGWHKLKGNFEGE